MYRLWFLWCSWRASSRCCGWYPHACPGGEKPEAVFSHLVPAKGVEHFPPKNRTGRISERGHEKCLGVSRGVQ